MGGYLHFTYHISIRNNEVNSLISGSFGSGKNVWICFSRTSLFDFHPSNFNLPTNTLICRYRPPMESNTDRGLWKGIPIHIYSTFTYITRLWFQKVAFLPLLVPGEMIEFDYFFQLGWNHQLDLASVYGMFIFVLTININRSSHRWYGKGKFFFVEDFNLQAASLMADVKVIRCFAVPCLRKIQPQ